MVGILATVSSKAVGKDQTRTHARFSRTTSEAFVEASLLVSTRPWRSSLHPLLFLLLRAANPV